MHKVWFLRKNCALLNCDLESTFIDIVKLKNLCAIISFPVDITVYHRGCHGDLNETFFVGNVDERSKKLVKTTHECLSLAIDEGVKAFTYFSFTLRFSVI